MTDSYVKTTIKDGGYAVVSLCREPVNSMHLDFWRQLEQTLTELEGRSDVHGMILMSALRKDVFTAGNDILELYAPKTTAERYRDFWVTQNTFLARLYQSPLVTIAAIRGACPAGGCVTALCCDARIMTDFGTFGLNEVALGIAVPPYWGKLMALTIGQRHTERLLLNGILPSAEEALSLGLVDATVTAANLLPRAEELMHSLLKAPTAARTITKRQLRAAFAESWQAFAPTEVDAAWQLLSSPEVSGGLARVLERLSKPK